MHVLYVHQNYPAQFGHVARHLVKHKGWQCTFVSETPAGDDAGIAKIQYAKTGGATAGNHFCARSFENAIWNSDGVYQALRARPDVRPDLIVGHSGFGSTLFLRELYPDVPVLNFFEFYYDPHDSLSDMTFRRDLAWPLDDYKFLRSRCRNATILLDLQNCQLGYCPTEFQRSRFPANWRDKLRVAFDGVDRAVYHGHGEALRGDGPKTLCGVDVPAGTRVVSYCARGFESMRGFDLFMRAAKQVCAARADTIFIVVGTDRVAYGGDANHTGGKTFKEWVLAQNDYDLSRIKFVGRQPEHELAKLLASADAHVYLTVPFVLSWSMVDAMSCGAAVVASRTAPVQELIADGETGLLADFFDPGDVADKLLRVLADPAQFRPLGRAAESRIERDYSLEAVLPTMLRAYDEALATKAGLEAPRPPAPPAKRQVLAAPRPAGTPTKVSRNVFAG